MSEADRYGRTDAAKRLHRLIRDLADIDQPAGDPHDLATAWRDPSDSLQ